jgi:hypothetical protein
MAMQVSPLSASVALILGFLVMVFGFAALRRPIDALIQNDPIGQFLLRTRGPQTTRLAYRIFGLSMILMGFATAFLALQALRA